MHYAVLLQFNINDQEKIIKYWSWISKNGGNELLLNSGLKPHITLSSFKDTNIEVFCDKLHAFASNTRKFKITLDSISTFTLNPDVIYLKPNITAELKSIYKDFHRYFSDTIENINIHCLPNNWSPHIAIAIKVKEDMTQQILSNFQKDFIPLEVCIEDIAIIENNVGKRYIAKFHLI